jgi:hypothetical protein
MRTFTVYRTNARNLKSEVEKDNYNDSETPQFQGVEFDDGTVAIRWLTPNRSTSIWQNLETLKKVHIYAHPDYGTRVEYSDSTVELL